MTIAPDFECPLCEEKWVESDPCDISNGSIVECPGCGKELEVEEDCVVTWSLMPYRKVVAVNDLGDNVYEGGRGFRPGESDEKA